MLRKLYSDERAQDLVEYGLLGAFVSVAAIATLRLISVPVRDIWEHIFNEIS